MKFFKCDNDNCQVTYSPSFTAVKLRGVGGGSGILLPDAMMRKDFCSAMCFWEWARENMPSPDLEPSE